MTMESVLVWLVLGALAGWLAGVIVKGYGFGLPGNIVVGILGAVIGGWLFGLTGLSTGGGFVGSLFGATAGAVILLFVIKLLRKAS